MTMFALPARDPVGRDGVFESVVVGIDGSPESFEAARQASRLVDDRGPLLLLSAWTLEGTLAVPVAEPPSGGEELSRRSAEESLRRVQSEVPECLLARRAVVRGFASHALLDEIRHSDATLVAVGSHGQGRAAGLLQASTASALIRGAPCSVLVSRPAEPEFPRRIVVGVDGSEHSARAYAAAVELRERFGSDVTAVVAEDGKSVDETALALVEGGSYSLVGGDPVRALLTAARAADLLLVGSRGLHGLRSLGSVSERVAHRAGCSTLIVRPVA